jgi:hypothetical protein
MESEMNERIKELAKQAYEDVIKNTPSFLVTKELYEQKFAELIVRECISIVEPTSHHEAFAQGYMGGVDGLDLLYGKVKQIKQHFGVEA